MRKIYTLVCCYLAFLSCDKHNGPANTTSLCFDTTFIATPIIGIKSIFFTNARDGFASSVSGEIYKTTDSAKNWTVLNSNTSLPILGLWFINDQTGFAVGGESSCGTTGCTPAGGFILKTTDGGQSWTSVYTSSVKIAISSIYFVSPTEGFCIGGNVIYKTTDEGQSWTEYKVDDLHGMMTGIGFHDIQKGYISCVNDTILVTENSGESWKKATPNRNIGYYAVSAPDDAVFVSGQGKMIKSTDGGISWRELPNSPGDIYSLHFLNSRVGFAFGRGNYSGGDFGHSYGSIYCTDNGGLSWNGTAEVKQTDLIEAISFPDDQTGYAASGNTIIKLTLH